MELDFKVVLQVYKDELARLQNEVLLLKAQIIQMQQMDEQNNE